MTQPIVTVYITNYNYAAYLKDSIESVINQTYSNIELLIIDDGSTDNSREIMQEYASLINVELLFQQNLGLNRTNNVALKRAKGKYLVRLDADDFFEPNAIETMVKVLEADDELGLVFPDYFYVDKFGKRIGEERRHDFGKDVTVFDQPAHGACTMVRTEMLRNLGGYDEQFSCQDGYDLWIKFVTNHKVTNVNQPLFSYRRHGNNLTENEARILSTRRQIKRVYVTKKMRVPPTVLIIPVRHTMLNGVNWLLDNTKGASLLEQKINVCLNAMNPVKVVVTSSSKAIQEFVEDKFVHCDKFQFVLRSEDLEMSHIPLAQTVEHVLTSLQSPVEAVMTVSVDYPFLSPDAIDEAIDSLVIFKADAVVSVRPDNSMYYRHVGTGMQPILNQDQFTKLEREALYKASGGIMLSRLEQLRKTGKSVSGNVAHIIVESKESLQILDMFYFNVYKSMSFS